MKCFCDIDYNLIISIFALIVAVIALYVSTRYQIITLISAQLSDKAKECNSNLGSNNEVTKENNKVSGILSSIITAEELYYYRVKLKLNPLIWFLDHQSIIDQFYLQLHTSVRVFIEKDGLNTGDIQWQGQLDILQTQFKRSKAFLKISIKKSKCKKFEQLQHNTSERNQKYFKQCENLSD